MKRIFTMCIIMCTLSFSLYGCGKGTKSDSNVKKDTAGTVPTERSESTEQTDVKTQHISDGNMEDFKFEGECYIQEEGKPIKYQGEITKESVKKDLWNLICEQEKADCYQGGTIGGGLNLKLTNQATGEVINVGYTIWYEQPENDGGPTCFVISGENVEGGYYRPLNSNEQNFDELIKEGIVCDENIVEN